MIGTIFILGILLLRVFQKISSKAISNDIPSNIVGLSGYNAISMGISAAFAAILLIFNFSIKEFTNISSLGWIIACLTGATICVSSICSLLAMRGSSILLNSLFGMAGLLVPTISGIFIFDQKVEPMQWLGLISLFVAALLLTSSSKKTNGKITVKTVLLLLGSMLSNGCTMLLQVLYKTYVPMGSVLVYSFLQFSITAAVLFVIAFIWSKITNSKIFVPNKKLMSFTFISAGSLFGISQLSTMASAIVPIAILFPVSDGGGMIISALVGDMVYKEKMNIKSYFGIIVGVVGILFMKLFSNG